MPASSHEYLRMHLQPSRRSIAPLLLLVLVVASGCFGVVGQEGVPDRSTVAESLDSIDAVEATATMEMDVGNDTTTMRMQFVERMDTAEFRATMTQTSPNASYTMVSNGTTTWVYNESANAVTHLEIEGKRSQWDESTAAIAGTFGALSNSTDAEDVSISPLPVVPSGNGSGAVGAAGVASMPSIGNVSVTYQGTETVLGRDAHVVDVAPADEQSVLRNGTLWFDAERFYPIRAEYDMSVGAQRASVSVAYRNLTYNPEIADDAFTFEPPANATIKNETRSIASYVSRAELVDAAEQSVPEPELPDDFTFARASTVASDGNRTLSMQYANESTTLVVEKTTASGGPRNESAQSVDIASQDGWYRTAGDRGILVWECEDSQYAIVGSLPKESLRSMAESMVCG